MHRNIKMASIGLTLQTERRFCRNIKYIQRLSFATDYQSDRRTLLQYNSNQIYSIKTFYQNQQQFAQYSTQLNDNNEEKEKTFLKKFKTIINVFWIGCRALYTDVKLALQTRRKLGLYQQRDISQLSREEVRHMRQTRQDVVKTFPAVLLFMIPFVGYIAPVIAYFYPKQLLSQQFWHPDQKKDFVLEEYEKRSQYYFPLIKEVAITCKEIQNKHLLKLCLDILDGKHPSNEEMLPFKHLFTDVADLTIEQMPRYHLVKICKCWLIPTRWYIPRWFLMNALRRRISRLHEDDLLIVRDGIEFLTSDHVEQAVQFRGLDETLLADELKLHWLQQWVSLATMVSGDDLSFLAHCAVFKAANFEVMDEVMGESHSDSN